MKESTAYEDMKKIPTSPYPYPFTSKLVSMTAKV